MMISGSRCKQEEDRKRLERRKDVWIWGYNRLI